MTKKYPCKKKKIKENRQDRQKYKIHLNSSILLPINIIRKL